MAIRYSAVAVLAATALLLSGCSADTAGQPLASGTVQKGEKVCSEAPNTDPSAGVPAWNSQIGWAVNTYYNISAKTPAGGWAIGQQVTYRQGNAQYTIRSYTGYAIGPPGPGGPKCQAQENAITAAWQGP